MGSLIIVFTLLTTLQRYPAYLPSFQPDQELPHASQGTPQHLTFSGPERDSHGKSWHLLKYVPLALSVTIPLDQAIMPLRDDFDRSSSLQDISRGVSFLGKGAVLTGAGLLGYLVGTLAGRDTIKDLSWDLLKGAALTTAIVVPLKWSTGRLRPFQLSPEQSAFKFEPFDLHGFNRSFPSGHTALSFMTATVISQHTHKTWIKVLAYGIASAIALSRITGNRHHPSDVAIGALIGIGTGWYVSR